MSSVDTSTNATVSTTTGPSGADRVLGALQSVGRSLMLPIAVLPAAALLLRLGQPEVLNLPWMANAGNAIFANLPLIFAIGIAVGLTSGEGAAALAALVGFLVFAFSFTTIYAPAQIANPLTVVHGSIDVLSGILIGLTAAGLYRRFYDIRLPDYLAFFGGRRFVPILTAVVALILGVIFGYIWSPVQNAINALGTAIVSLGPLGPGIYGFLNRLLIPLGLHHILNSYVWFQLGTYHGTHGDLNRYFAGDPTAGNFMAGFFPIMMFGLPAACLAMIRHANFPKVAAGILLSAAFASFLTGITEPIEFAFLFVAPVLYLIHAILTGTALAICTALGIRIGFGFSAGLIDYVLNFRAPNTTQPLLLLVVGLVYAVLYYFIFSFFITRFNLGTPGRGEASTGLAPDWILPESQRGPKKVKGAATQQATASNGTAATDRDDVLAGQVLAALGGKANVQSVEGCITRLRLFVNDPAQIDDALLKSLGASGVIKRGKIAQVVMGTQSDRIASRMNRLLKDGNTDDNVEEGS
jgi:N-acetylglucosamine PTS system EIICBA or EIICB component